MITTWNILFALRSWELLGLNRWVFAWYC